MKNLTLFFLLMTIFSFNTLAVSTANDSGHYSPAWRNGRVDVPLGTYQSGTYGFGEQIKALNGLINQSTYYKHFHLNFTTQPQPRFSCNKNIKYKGVINTAEMGPVLGEHDGYAIIKSNVPGVGYRLEIGAIFSSNYTTKATSYSPVGANGDVEIEIPCILNKATEFTLDVRMTLVKTNEIIDDNIGKNYINVNVSPSFPRSISVYDDENSLVLIGEWGQQLSKPSNIRVKYIKESCRYYLSGMSQTLNLGEVKSKQFDGVGSTATGDSGQQKIDVTINCGGTKTIKNIRASIFENDNTNQAAAGLRKEGVLLNNLTGPDASKGVGVQVLINDMVKPLGIDSPVYINDDTQWDIAKSSSSPLTGTYTFTVSGRYYQVEPKIKAGKLQTTMGFILIYR